MALSLCCGTLTAGQRLSEAKSCSEYQCLSKIGRLSFSIRHTTMLTNVHNINISLDYTNKFASLLSPRALNRNMIQHDHQYHLISNTN